MAEAQVERRLAAILSADVAGYSRLMSADEEGTLAQLKAHRLTLVDPKIAQHRGRIVKTTGDGILVEFASVVDALRCAVDVQRAMADHNANVPQAKRIEFRVGIHQGDIISDGGDIFGDGVNVAARLERIGEPAGICVSARVQEDTRGKLDVAFEDMGEQQLKNIAVPVRAYRVRFGGGPDCSVRPVLALPAKPSIAVLPFQNLSAEPEQDYFADGMAEDIITALSRFNELFVIARNSSFTYKGRAVDVKQVGRELGVRYVLEGSVRKAGNRIRITGQLIDAMTAAHLWANHFDGALDNVFDLQDEIASNVVCAIAPKLQQAEIERAKRKPTDSLDAYDYYLRGVATLYRWTKDASEMALPLFCRAIDLDPEYGCAYGMAARCQVWRHANLWISEGNELNEAVLLARRAVTFGSDEPIALAAGGFALAYLANELDAGAELIDRALVMNPNMATAWHFSCWIRIWLGSPDLALTHERRAMRLSPLDPLLGQMQLAAAQAELSAGHFLEASSWGQKATRITLWPWGLAIAAASSALAGRIEEAHNAAERLRQLAPELKVSDLANIRPFRQLRDLAIFEEGLRKAGMPE